MASAMGEVRWVRHCKSVEEKEKRNGIQGVGPKAKAKESLELLKTREQVVESN